ncbi:MAG: sigma-70 family RNA polymerase sigma factor [Kiritimatiellae bacterium]|nr:sigma-70 family RNA polymerase sigma factor [Kiritimatiellia bacterium]
MTPKTSTTLLRDLAQDSQHARWAEFVARYRPMMDAYMRERFPFVEADDAIQETLIALIKTFPVYNYSPEETGAFHNYLTGILRNKALCQIERERRHSANLRAYADEMRNAASSGASPRLESSHRDIFEIALRQLLADKSVHELTREVFRRVAVNGEDPEEVASDIGKTRNAVYQMKDRMMTRLKGFVAALEKVEAEQNGRG